METVPTAVPPIEVGTRVSYADVANPLRVGTIVGEVAGQWLVAWDGDAELEVDVLGVKFSTSVTKAMLQRAAELAAAMRAEGRGRRGGWGVEPTCTTCGRPADAGYVNERAGERCVDAVHDAQLRASLRDPHLLHDFDVLRSCSRAGGQVAFATAVEVRRQLAADTLAPTWLRCIAQLTVDALRAEVRS